LAKTENIRERIREYDKKGWPFAVTVYLIVAVLVCSVLNFIYDKGYETLAELLSIPVFFMALVMAPIADWYSRFLRRRHCRAEGHEFEDAWQSTDGVTKHIRCALCECYQKVKLPVTQRE
jgi:L-asparagine transporter-like permease